MAGHTVCWSTKLRVICISGRSSQKKSNFDRCLPAPQSELAVQTMKAPYIFDFVPFKENMVERDIEKALVQDVTKLLLELGTGFALLGNQYHLNVGVSEYRVTSVLSVELESQFPSVEDMRQLIK